MIPKIGEYWPEEGGFFCGQTGSFKGSERLLILADDSPRIKLCLYDAEEWALSYKNLCADYRLPSLEEGIVLRKNALHLLKTGDCWLQRTSSPNRIWAQDFHYDRQFEPSNEHHRYNVCMVRSIPHQKRELIVAPKPGIYPRLSRNGYGDLILIEDESIEGEVIAKAFSPLWKAIIYGATGEKLYSVKN